MSVPHNHSEAAANLARANALLVEKDRERSAASKLRSVDQDYAAKSRRQRDVKANAFDQHGTQRTT